MNSSAAGKITPPSSVSPSLTTSSAAHAESLTPSTAAPPLDEKAAPSGVGQRTEVIASDRILGLERELRLIREEGREQRLRTEQLLAQLESEARLRRDADEIVSQLNKDLQNERAMTLEKDLELKRAETLLMMSKAREEIQQSKMLVAQAQEELAQARAAKAEAMFETAKVDAERMQLLAYIHSIGGPTTAAALSPVGLIGKREVPGSSNLSILSTQGSSPAVSGVTGAS